MKVVLFGASGMIGSRILQELVARGHEVTAVARNTSRIAEPKAKAVKGDVLDPKSILATARGADAVISAYAPPHEDVSKALEVTKNLLHALPEAGVMRLLMVGGAGSLEVAPGLQLVDAPNFPEEWKNVALAHRDVLNLMKTADLDWTYLSPAAMIQPGHRTGKFRLGKDSLVTDDKGESRISAEDYAVAMVDELEKPQHIRQRFTLAY